MFNLFKKKNVIPYEEFGYMYADSFSPSLIDPLVQSANAWVGRSVDSERLGQDLSMLCLAIFQLSLIDLIPAEDASGRAIVGFMKRLAERYENFDFDANTTTIVMEYIRAAGVDMRNKQKKESFPTLVPLAINRITGLTREHENWPAATEVIYSIIETVLKTSRATLTGINDHARLV